MWRLFGMAALLVLILQPAAAATLDRVRETNTFRIGYRADAKPHSYRTEQGQPAGYVVDLCREVAAAIIQLIEHVRVTYVLVPADQRFAAVRDGRVDVLCDPSSVTLARRELVDFSLPTFLDGASVLSRSGRPVERFEDLAGKRVGVLTGTTTETTLREGLAAVSINASVVPVRDHRDGIGLLEAQKVDAYFADRAIITALLYERGRPGFTLSKQYFSYETHALALPRGDDAFRLLVDRTLARLYRSGRINAILAKTFGNAPPGDMLRTMFIINSLPER
ncbi:MAG TPA: amino acid ABC transporter substrate-binding protein [Xanthobacteraceae bacterium]|nr:amino acid ABC transporter substrate-binding protein [Xanthobacteraceae bacterium]